MNIVKPGQYVLAHDVKNPKPDRRQRYDWRAEEIWNKGREFKIEEDRAIELPDGQKAYRILPTWNRWSSQTLPVLPRDKQAAALLAALVPAPRNGRRDLKAAFDERRYGEAAAFDVLARLIDAKVVEVEQVAEILAQKDAEYDAEEAR